MLFQSLKMAWESVRSNKMRSFLTMLGIIIGVFALVVLVSIVSGATGSITDSISSMGKDAITINVLDDKGKPLSYNDIQGLKDEEDVAQVSPYVSVMTTLQSSRHSESGTVYGVNGAYASISGDDLAAGRFLTNTDYNNNSYVAVVTQQVIEDILGTRSAANAIGETLDIAHHPVTVVGVLEDSDTSSSSGNSSMFGMSQYTVYVPYSTLVRISSSSKTIASFVVSSTRSDNLEAAQNEVGDWLKKRFNDDEDAFYIFNFEDVMNILGDVTSTLSLVMGGVAAISLLVGGIGIMNIMLVSVTERTREIGIRKAIGASRQSILMQFLIEAMMISIIGCIIGIIFSWAALKIISDVWGRIQFSLNPGVVVLACVFSLAIGVIFGSYPANKAAKKNPIEALHYAG